MPRKSNTRAASGSGSIRQRPDGTWEARFVVGHDPGTGKPIRKSVYAKTQKELKKKIAAWNQEQAAGKTFEACADAWERWHEGQVSYNGAEAYRAAMKRTKEQFKGRRIDDIRPDEIDAYIRYLAGRGYARRTVQLYLDMLRMIWDYSIVQALTGSGGSGE